MGLLSWWRGKEEPAKKTAAESGAANMDAKSLGGGAEVPGMHGAVEVLRRPADVTVFEFGSAAAAGDRVTMAGYCPVSEDLEPCHWEILTAPTPDAPLFRIVF